MDEETTSTALCVRHIENLKFSNFWIYVLSPIAIRD